MRAFGRQILQGFLIYIRKYLTWLNAVFMVLNFCKELGIYFVLINLCKQFMQAMKFTV